MPAPKRKSAAQLQAQCDAWNAKHPEGTLVSFESIKGEGETHRGKTVSEAQVMGGHSAVIWIENKSGCVSLDHCTPVPEEGGAATQVHAAADADKLMEELLGKMNGVENDADVLAVLIESADSIRTIAAAYRTTRLFERASAQYAEFKAAIESDTPPEARLLSAWKWMVDRMANAPTIFHVIASVRLCLPLVAEYLPEEAASVEKGSQS